MAEGLAGSFDEPQVLAELVGTELGGRYQLERVLGAGAMGAVFEGTDLRLGRPVAVKVMQPGYAREAEYVKRFLREAQAASKIRHRNVVVVLDYGQANGGRVYSVMELLVGQDLEAFLRGQPGQRLPWAQACGLLVQVASGLRAAHRQGVIHRDIKPANCFVTTEDEELVMKVVDFGIAKLDEGMQTQQLTGTGDVLGTPSYTAPELVLAGGPASPRSDVYSLGVVAYRMLTGRLPFTGKTAFEVMHRACIEPVPGMREPGVELPEALEQLVLEMLAKTPEQRPADMGEVRQLLQAFGPEVGGVQGAVESVGSSSLRIEVGKAEVSGEVPRTEVLDYGKPDPVERTAVMATVVSREVTRTELLGWGRPDPAEQTAVVATAVLPALERTEVVAAAPQGLKAQGEAVPERAAKAMGPVPCVGETLPEQGGVTVHMGDGLDDPRPRPTFSGRRFVGVGALVVVVLGGMAWWMIDRGGNMPGSPAEADSVADVTEAARVGHETRSTPTKVFPILLEARKSKAPAVEPEAEPEVTVGDVPAVAEEVVEEPPATNVESHKPRRSKTPMGPPSDAKLKKKLARKIKAKCSADLAGGSATVVFDVTRSGEIKRLTAMPKGAAGECAKRQVASTRFRARESETNVEIEVSRAS